jgi:hypothetical protein
MIPPKVADDSLLKLHHPHGGWPGFVIGRMSLVTLFLRAVRRSESQRCTVLPVTGAENVSLWRSMLSASSVVSPRRKLDD